MHSLRAQHKKDVNYLESLLNYSKTDATSQHLPEIASDAPKEDSNYNPLFKHWKPIGQLF